MLRWRLLASAVLILLLLLVFYLDARAGAAAPLLLVVALLLAAGCAWELISLLSGGQASPSVLLTGMCTVAVVGSGWVGRAGAGSTTAGEPLAGVAAIGLVYAATVLLLLLNRVGRYREMGGNVHTLGVELAVVSYVGVLLGMTAQLRWVAGAEAGYLVLGSLVVAAKSGDVGAYTLGRLFGRRKMSPRLSPGKTWVGAAGALFASTVSAVLWFSIATPLFNAQWDSPAWYFAAGYGAVVGLAGIVGDLCESLIKRDANAKDSSRWLPGFGGLLDLLDSILYAGPVAYFLWLVLPLQTW